LGKLIELKGKLQEEREWVDLADKYSMMVFRKDQQILALMKQNELLYDEVGRLQKIILGGDAEHEMSELQQ
jgi:hypothetical protein